MVPPAVFVSSKVTSSVATVAGGWIASSVIVTVQLLDAPAPGTLGVKVAVACWSLPRLSKYSSGRT